jgi:hypothetical protein
VEIEGTVCRCNRSVDRLILEVGGKRQRVAVDRSVRVTFEGRWYEAGDLRPGDRILVFGERDDTGTLRPGDLLEIGGTWTKQGEIRASSIRVLTDDEPSSCLQRARQGETKEDTATREAAEQRFLDGYAPE